MRQFTRPDNQQKALLPLNPITENIWYTDGDGENTRMVVSAKMKHPIVWKVTKYESTSPLGLVTLTFYQNYWNEHTDYIEKDENGNIIGMWADYFKSSISPINPPSVTPSSSTNIAKISVSTSTIKVGGSYKNLTVSIYNNSNEDITTEYSDATISWTCSIDDEDWTEKVIWRNGSNFNQMKLKFPSDTLVIGKILKVRCTIGKNDKTIESEILELELVK